MASNLQLDFTFDSVEEWEAARKQVLWEIRNHEQKRAVTERHLRERREVLEYIESVKPEVQDAGEDG